MFDILMFHFVQPCSFTLPAHVHIFRLELCPPSDGKEITQHGYSAGQRPHELEAWQQIAD